MELQEYVRKPFPVKAVQVDFQNAYQVAEWCKGSVVLRKTRLLGGAGKGEMDLPTVVFKGTGDYRDKEFVAGMGDWIVELRGNFRVFKKAQFKATFEPAPKKEIEKAEVIETSLVTEDQTLPGMEIQASIERDGAFASEEEAIAEQEREEALHNAGQV